MAGEEDPQITSPKLMAKIRNASLSNASEIGKLAYHASRVTGENTHPNFCMVIDWMGAGNKTPDAAHLCMFCPAPTSSTSAATTYHEIRTSLEIKDTIENFRLILMDMFQERIGSRDPFFAEIFEMMKSQLLDEGPDSIHHVNIDYQVRSVEGQLVEFAKLYTNGDNEHMDFEEFKKLNKKTLQINTSRWLDDHSRLDRTKIPRQVVAPPGFKPTQPLKSISTKHSSIRTSVHQSEDYGIPKEIEVVGMVRKAEVVMEEEEDMEVSSMRSRKKIH